VGFEGVETSRVLCTGQVERREGYRVNGMLWSVTLLLWYGTLATCRKFSASSRVINFLWRAPLNRYTSGSHSAQDENIPVLRP
jgi:hypothetical protein